MWMILSSAVLFHLIQDAGALLPIELMQYHGRNPAKQNRMKNCSIHQSAIVRQILLADFFPIFQKYGVKVPMKCKFHKDRDIFSQIESNKTNDHGIFTKCEICGKEFFEQYYFYEHAVRKHSEFFLQGSKAVCLADYCPMFRCDLHQKYPHDIPNEINCNSKNVEKLRRKCEYLMQSCLPEKMFHYVYDQLYLAICSTLTCEKFLHPFQDSISLTTVVALSIAIPVLLYFLGQALLACYDNMDRVDDEEKYLRAQQARYQAMNAEYNARFHGIRNGTTEARFRKPTGYVKYSNKFSSKYGNNHQYIRPIPGRNSISIPIPA